MKRKKGLLLTIISLLAVPRLFASQATVQALEDVASKFLEFFTSTPVQLFFAIALAGIGIGFIANRDNQQIKQKFMFWGLGVGIVLGASGITDLFFTEGVLVP